MNVADLPEDSDSSDEDYIPNEKLEDLPSEIEEDDHISESEETSKKIKRKGKAAKKKKQQANNKKEEPQEIKQESDSKKNNVDDLWADFVKDTGFKYKTNSKSDIQEPQSSKPKQTNSVKSVESTQLIKKPPERVKVTQIFEFAGEEVKVEKEVAADSAEARLSSEKQTLDSNSSSKIKRPAGLTGIGNVLNQLSKKPKISTLEKTKLDWDSYKKDHRIEEELQTFNKGKDGYLERQDFLQRTDLRRFEIEKNVRDVERSKRFNTTM